jgi:hypothetical protein
MERCANTEAIDKYIREQDIIQDAIDDCKQEIADAIQTDIEQIKLQFDQMVEWNNLEDEIDFLEFIGDLI